MPPLRGALRKSEPPLRAAEGQMRLVLPETRNSFARPGRGSRFSLGPGSQLAGRGSSCVSVLSPSPRFSVE